MTDEQRNEIVNKLNNMSKIEIGYLRELFMENFPFVALGYTLSDIIWAIDCCVENEYDKIKRLLVVNHY
jgi:hypothetical protein